MRNWGPRGGSLWWPKFESRWSVQFSFVEMLFEKNENKSNEALFQKYSEIAEEWKLNGFIG